MQDLTGLNAILEFALGEATFLGKAYCDRKLKLEINSLPSIEGVKGKPIVLKKVG